MGFRGAIRIRKCRACGHRFVQAEGFDSDAAYDATYSGFTRDPVFEERIGAFVRNEIVPRTGEHARVLDVGCGNGAVLEAARSAGLVAKGVDVSGPAVDGCRARGLDAVQGDFTTLDLGGEQFDAVMFWDVLEHLVDPRSFIERAANLLKPRAWIFLKVPGHGELSVGLSAFVPRIAGAVLQVPHHLQLYTRASLDRLLTKRFDSLTWIEVGGMRGRTSGGSAKRRLARKIVGAIHKASGDGNYLVVARKR